MAINLLAVSGRPSERKSNFSPLDGGLGEGLRSCSTLFVLQNIPRVLIILEAEFLLSPVTWAIADNSYPLVPLPLKFIKIAKISSTLGARGGSLGTTNKPLMLPPYKRSPRSRPDSPFMPSSPCPCIIVFLKIWLTRQEVKLLSRSFLEQLLMLWLDRDWFLSLLFVHHIQSFPNKISLSETNKIPWARNLAIVSWRNPQHLSKWNLVGLLGAIDG